METKEASRTSKIIRNFTNKYVLVGILFLVWITFFDKNSFVEKSKISQKIKTLTKDKEYYQTKIEEESRKTRELLSNKENLEKFAREQYLMKNPDEDIFIIVE